MEHEQKIPSYNLLLTNKSYFDNVFLFFPPNLGLAQEGVGY